MDVGFVEGYAVDFCKVGLESVLGWSRVSLCSAAGFWVGLGWRLVWCGCSVSQKPNAAFGQNVAKAKQTKQPAPSKGCQLEPKMAQTRAH